MTRKLNLALVLSVLVLSGCASLKGGLTSTQQVDLTPFADQTISLVGGGEYSLPESVQAILIREFFDYQDPDFVELNELEGKADLLIRRVIAYSIQLVTLSESSKTEAERIAAYAEYLDALKKTSVMLEAWNIPPEDYDRIMTDIRGQEKLLEALRAAQPLINEINRLSGLLFDDMEMSLSNIVIKIESAIDTEYRDILTFYEIIESEKKGTIKGLQLLHEYRDANVESLDSLKDWIRGIDVLG